MLFVGIEGPFLSDTRRFERFQHDALFFWREGQFAATAHEIAIASEAGDALVAEGAILIGEHLLLEIGESSGEGGGIVVAIVGTGGILHALGRIDNAQDLVRLQELLEGKVAQAGGFTLAVVVQTGIV